VSVAIDYVDAQLTQLWRDVAEAAQAKGGLSAVTMAQVLNLVVRADSYSSANEYLSDMNKITGSHPARVINIITDSSEEEMAVQAWASIFCQIPPAGGRQVCAEQISVAAAGTGVRQIPAAVIPLLLPELPVFLWWPKGSPFDDYLFRQLADSLNRVIIDSATFENPEGTLAKMSTRLKNDWPKMACTDMNWSRLTRWRELTAQFFDGAALRSYLDRINRVQVRYALSKRGGPVNRSQALLYAGWLASRLAWQPIEPVYEVLRSDGNRPASARLNMLSGDRRIVVELLVDDEQCETAGEIISVHLEVAGEAIGTPPEAVFEVSVSEEEDCAWTKIDLAGADSTKRTFQLDMPTRAMLLDGELEVFSHDRIYEEALALTGTFIRGVSRKEPEGTRKIATGEPVSAGAQVTRKPPVVRPK